MRASLSLLCRLPLCMGLVAASLRAQDGYDSGGYPPELVKRLGLDQTTPPERIGTWLRIRGMATAPVWPATGGPEDRSAGGQMTEAGGPAGSVLPVSGPPSSGFRPSDGSGTEAEVARVREALARLRAAGYRSACMLRWERAWPSGGRSGSKIGNRAPLDLREAYARARALAETYGDLVDAWEFENEPDIGFFADNGDVFTAYYKAVALGIVHGRERAWARVRARSEGTQSDRATAGRPEGRRTEDGGRMGRRNDRATEDGAADEGVTERQNNSATDVSRKTGGRLPRLGGGVRVADADRDQALPESDIPSGDLSIGRSISLSAPSLVVMPALALPPGPYLEQILANGFLSYTEGVNLHYYGFAEDYADAHARLREALADDGGDATEGRMRATDRQSDSATDLDRQSGPAEGTPFRYALQFFKVRPRSMVRSSGHKAPSVALSVCPSAAAMPRRLPVFVTEWGYPRLDGYAAQTVEGRVRQWRFFRYVQKTNERLGVAAPMAFYLPPYFEYGAKEFGLSMPQPERHAAHYGFAIEQGAGSRERGAGESKAGANEVERVSDVACGSVVPNALDRSDSPAGTNALGTTRSTFTAGGLVFRLADFGAEAPEPWMRRIGERVGDGEASPALAWLWEQGAGGAEDRNAGEPEDGGPEAGGPEVRRNGKSEGRRGHFRSPSSYANASESAAVFRPSGPPVLRSSGRGASEAADWLVHTEAASPVVIDFIAGEGTVAVKNYNGYWLSEAGGAEGPTTEAGGQELRKVERVSDVACGSVVPDALVRGASADRGVVTPVPGVQRGASEGTPDTGVATRPAKTGRGVLVFYNFGAEPAELSWVWPSGLRPAGPLASDPPPSGALSSVARPLSRRVERLMLAAGERREIAVDVSVPDGRFAPADRRLAVAVRCGGERTVSRWATRVYPIPEGYAPEGGRTFAFPGEAAAKHRAWLLARPHASEEPRLGPDGRWLVTPGVRVEETASGWRFHVQALPGQGLWPAVAELPLPDGWAPWEQGLMLSYDYRVAPASFALRAPLRPDDPDATRRLQTGRIGDLIESYLRTETGNLYSTQPRLTPTPAWKRYNQTAETLTLHFPGRLAAPWRVEEQRPASLVFFLRPAGLPTVFEIADPRLAHWWKAD